MSILAKIEGLDQYTHIALAQFPKVEKHVMCEDIRRTISIIEHETIRAGKKFHKKTTLQDLDIEVEYMRLQIRKARALGYLSMKKFEIISQKIDEIGKMVGGWLRADKASEK